MIHVRLHAVLGYKSTTIVELMREEGLDVKVSGVCRLLKIFAETGTICHCPGNIFYNVF